MDTPLFSYDTKETEEELGQAEIDLERIENEISTANSQIEQLEKEKKTAEADEQLSYTTQIQTAQVEVKKKEYEKKSKAVEIEQIRDSINNATGNYRLLSIPGWTRHRHGTEALVQCRVKRLQFLLQLYRNCEILGIRYFIKRLR